MARWAGQLEQPVVAVVHAPGQAQAAGAGDVVAHLRPAAAAAGAADVAEAPRGLLGVAGFLHGPVYGGGLESGIFNKTRGLSPTLPGVPPRVPPTPPRGTHFWDLI